MISVLQTSSNNTQQYLYDCMQRLRCRCDCSNLLTYLLNLCWNRIVFVTTTSVDRIQESDTHDDSWQDDRQSSPVEVALSAKTHPQNCKCLHHRTGRHNSRLWISSSKN